MKNYSLFCFTFLVLVVLITSHGKSTNDQVKTCGITEPANIAFDLSMSFLITLICHVKIRRQGALKNT